MLPRRSLGVVFAITVTLATVAFTSNGCVRAQRSTVVTSQGLRGYHITVRELSPGVYLAVQESPAQSSANVLIARMPDGTVVFCSSPYDTDATRALVRAVRRWWSPQRLIAINTHFHADGTAGNEGYAAEGVVTYASDHTVRLQRERGRAGLEGMARYVEAEAPELAARIRSTQMVFAENIFSEREGTSFTLGGETVRVIYPGAGHSADNVIVYFPARRVLFGGCMVRSGATLGNTADGDLGQWDRAAEAALALSPRVVVPGHGEPGGQELLRRTVELVRGRRR